MVKMPGNCRTVHFSTVQCSAFQWSALHYSAIQCSGVQYSSCSVQCSAIQCSKVLFTALEQIYLGFSLNRPFYLKTPQFLQFYVQKWKRNKVPFLCRLSWWTGLDWCIFEFVIWQISNQCILLVSCTLTSSSPFSFSTNRNIPVSCNQFVSS